jgi:hypothetical protein
MTTMWTVRGVSVDGRKAAKMAAAASGAPVGKWLERAIENLASAELYDRAKAAELPKKEKGVASEPAADPAPAEVAKEPLHPEARARRAPKGKKTCEHGVGKGESCWKCGGLARIE